MKTNYWEKLEPDVIYHIYNRAVGSANLFSTNENYMFFIQQWKKYLPYLDVFAFCLMPNHFHFLVKVKPLNNELKHHVSLQKTVKSQRFADGSLEYYEYLEDQFKRCFSSYALAYNKQQARHGSLFQKRFKRISIIDEYKLHYMLAYIHHNPIHHYFCSSYDEWKYSSWKAYQNLQQYSLLNREEVLYWFDADVWNAQSRFIQYHEGFKNDMVMSTYTLEG